MILSVVEFAVLVALTLLFVDKLEVLLAQHECRTEVFLAHHLVFGEFFGLALEQNPALKQQVCTVGNGKRLLHVVVGYEDTDVAVFESPHHMLYLFDGNRVDTSKGFVEHDELRVDSKTACYLRTTAFATRQLVAKILAYLAQIEVGNEFFELVELLLACESGHLEHSHNVVLDAQLTENARLLRQVAYA